MVIFVMNLQKKAIHESDRTKALLPSGQTREHLKPKFSCTLDSRFAGPISEQKIDDLAKEFSKSIYYKELKARYGRFPTETQWTNILSDPKFKKDFDKRKKEYTEYLKNFTQAATRPTGHANKPYERVTVMDADKLCMQQRLDGVQEIEYKGKPITTIKELPPVPLPVQAPR